MPAALAALDMVLLDASRTLGCRVPPLLFVRADAVARAYYVSMPLEGPGAAGAAALTWRLRPAIVVTSATLEMLTRPELRALFGGLLTHSVTPASAGADLAAAAGDAGDGAQDTPATHATRMLSSSRQAEFAARSGGVGWQRVDASRLHGWRAAAGGPPPPPPLQGNVQRQAFAATGTVATVAALAELAPEAVEVLAADGGWSERAEAAAAAGGPLAGMRAAARRQLRPALRLARQLLHFAEDRGAMLVAQVRPAPRSFMQATLTTCAKNISSAALVAQVRPGYAALQMHDAALRMAIACMSLSRCGACTSTHVNQGRSLPSPPWDYAASRSWHTVGAGGARCCIAAWHIRAPGMRHACIFRTPVRHACMHLSRGKGQATS